MSRYYVTTPIYYVNDKPHLGHAYTTLCADVLARWHRQKGDEVFFLTGTDEHGAKVEQAASDAKLSALEFSSQNAARFKEAWQALDVSNDYFIRTSQSEHEQVVTGLIQKIYDAGYIYEGSYEGLYCVGCEKYLKEDDLVEGKCPLHPNSEPIKQKEKNYFFKLSEFRDKLLKAIDKGTYQIIPESRRNEVVGKLKQGLEDLSISRESVEWGVRVPWDSKQTIYVWIDALINYFSATQFVPDKKDYWPANVHLLAKDILWFHAVIWEAMLMAAELPLPKVIATHGFFTIDGQKMSKSLGNVIDPIDLVKEFGVDATRYLILSQLSFTSDGDISLQRFRDRYTSDLANGLGNTFSRVTNMADKYGVASANKKNDKNYSINVTEELDNFHFDIALASIFGHLRLIDQEIEQTKPWQMAKDGQVDQVKDLLSKWIAELNNVSQALIPFMPDTSHRILQSLASEKIIKAEPLFPRLVN